MKFSKEVGAHDLSKLWLGLSGYYFRCENGDINIPAIIADNPGDGCFTRFIESLPDDEQIVVPNIINNRLQKKLEHLGWKLEQQWAEEYGEWVECFRRPTKESK